MASVNCPLRTSSHASALRFRGAARQRNDTPPHLKAGRSYSSAAAVVLPLGVAHIDAHPRRANRLADRTNGETAAAFRRSAHPTNRRPDMAGVSPGSKRDRSRRNHAHGPVSIVELISFQRVRVEVCGDVGLPRGPISSRSAPEALIRTGGLPRSVATSGRSAGPADDPERRAARLRSHGRSSAGPCRRPCGTVSPTRPSRPKRGCRVD